MTLFEKIQNSMDHLSNAKKSVAYYVLDNWYEVAFSTALYVSKKVNVSESVVVRFAQELGYAGFPALQKELQEVLKSRLVNIHSPEIDFNLKNIDNKENSIDKIHNLTLLNLENTYNSNTLETFESINTSIIKANRILILAKRNSFGPAHVLNGHINEIFSKSQVLDGESIEALDVIKGFKKDDLIIFISIPSYSKRMVLYSDYIKEKKIPQVAITNSYSTPFSKNSSQTLITKVNSYSFANSHTSTLFIIDVLIYLLTLNQKSNILKSLEELKVLYDRFDIIDVSNT